MALISMLRVHPSRRDNPAAPEALLPISHDVQRKETIDALGHLAFGRRPRPTRKQNGLLPCLTGMTTAVKRASCLKLQASTQRSTNRMSGALSTVVVCLPFQKGLS